MKIRSYLIPRLLCLATCLLISSVAYKLIVSQEPEENQSLSALINEREVILDDLDKLNAKIDTARSQVQELEDILVKKNERLGVIEGQINTFR